MRRKPAASGPNWRESAEVHAARGLGGKFIVDARRDGRERRTFSQAVAFKPRSVTVSILWESPGDGPLQRVEPHGATRQRAHDHDRPFVANALEYAAAASTRRIKLGTAVTVLSTDDPIRVFQQMATAAAIAPGRIDIVAGRGSPPITFPLFDQDEREYDALFRSKLELLLALNRHEDIDWTGPHRRRPLKNLLVVPRPEQPLKIWLGTGGSPESVHRAVELGLPMFLGILGGTPEHWAQYGRAYREG